ncbi:glycosyltransferase family 2 protein [Bosea lathyri]|uniref:Glycosyltransferase, catalytic subunit of cellulose synthase and poly-beta-1,6-N-acetylglucosamine synthase n=1 Tax=Bosea lathyri TaxID=1036778 RepID=A0A1H6A8Y5_9HYPH|nr:glycosyltransferase family 2 protein [Bosea lathyri]SEG45193.1 Glycosyltransferase, catalytic subunit of cellulose synthase and poly-beta-1,6-N-acetylglucosamine synthase [Bosea lathyri]
MGGGGNEDGAIRQEQALAGLPIEIAFLWRHGIAPSELAAAARRAIRIGSEPARELMALGSIDEAGFYRALAAELGVAFHKGPLALRPGGEYGAILRAGMAPVLEHPDLDFALAPEGPALRRLLDSGLRNRLDIAVTTPTDFAACLREANSTGLARHIAGLDQAGLARDSARTGATRGQRIALGGGTVLSALCGVMAPLEAFFALATLVGPLFLCVIVLRLAATLEEPDGELASHRRWRVDDSRLPVYTVAIPLFREEAVLPQIVQSLTALDYPAAKLDIKLLVEAEDAGLRNALSQIVLPAHFSVVIVPEGQPRTKPRALNLALLEARGSLFTIFDAEDIPDPRQLRLAAARFLRAPDELACLQARLVIDNAGDGILPALFAFEYAGLFDVLNPGLLRSQLPIMLGGTSNHFRTSVLRAIGGWDAWNVTEDADLGVRLARAGYRVGDLPSNTFEEAPLSMSAWRKQRSRWIKGYIQTLATHSRAPARLLREAGLSATLAFTAQALGTIVAALGYPIFAIAAVYAWSGGSLMTPSGTLLSLVTTLALTIAILGIFAMIAPPVLGALRRGSPRLLLLLPALPLYYGLVSVAAWVALYEYFTRPFVWNKTTHGLARQRGAGQIAFKPARKTAPSRS